MAIGRGSMTKEMFGNRQPAAKMNLGGTANLGDAMKQKVDAMGTRMSKGGKVGNRGDGIAIKGKTKGCMC